MRTFLLLNSLLTGKNTGNIDVRAGRWRGKLWYVKTLSE